MFRLRMVLFALSLASAANAATNLLVNPKFDVSVVGWKSWSQFQTITPAWQRYDAMASADSGSFAISATANAPNTAAAMLQCVQVTPGTRYEAGVKVMIPGGQPSTVNAFVAGRLYTSSDCSGSPLSNQWTALNPDGHIDPSHGTFTPLSARGIDIPANVHSTDVMLVVWGGPGPMTANFDDVYFGVSGGCVADYRTVCLDGGRFTVMASYIAPGETSKSAHLVQLTPDTAYMWFFDPDNVEVTIKVLNACSVSANHWVFTSGLTNVQVDITVIDTLTGAMQFYSNRQGTFYQPNFDTKAFNCP